MRRRYIKEARGLSAEEKRQMGLRKTRGTFDEEDYWGVVDKIDDAVNEICFELQKKYGIKSGDIDPFYALHLEKAEEDLARLIREIIMDEMETY